MYSRDLTIAVRPFNRQRDGDEVIVGNPDTGVFLALPPEAVDLLDQLAAGRTIGEVSDLYQKRYGEIPDLDDFLGLLRNKGFLGTPGDAENSRQLKTTGRGYHFSTFPQRLARRIFSKPALVIGFLLVALALAAIVHNRSLIPVPADLYFPHHRTLTWTILLAAYYGAIFLHELGHLVAARAVGINSRMGISQRLWYLVAETDLTGLWSVPKKKRYLPILAGILIDSVSAAVLILLLFATGCKWLAVSSFWILLMRALTFTYVMRILWEFFLFVRTDIYYLIATLFSCRSLLADTQVFLGNQLSRIIPWIRRVDQSSIPASERKVIRAYSVLWLGGRAWAFVTLFWVTLPVGGSYLSDLLRAWRAGYSSNPANFVDTLILAIYFLLPTVTGFVLWTSGSLRRKRTAI